MKKLLAVSLLAMVMAAPALGEEQAAAPAVKAKEAATTAAKKAAPAAAKKAAPTEEELAAAKKAAEEYEDPEADAKLKAMKKLAAKKKCAEVVMHKEVLPFFGKENTIKASQEITVEWERDDIVSGRAEVLDTHSRCNEIVGSLVVMCTTVTALCYHEKPKDVDKTQTLSAIEKQQAAARAVQERATQNEAAQQAAALKAEAGKKKSTKAE